MSFSGLYDFLPPTKNAASASSASASSSAANANEKEKPQSIGFNPIAGMKHTLMAPPVLKRQHQHHPSSSSSSSSSHPSKLAKTHSSASAGSATAAAPLPAPSPLASIFIPPIDSKSGVFGTYENVDHFLPPQPLPQPQQDVPVYLDEYNPYRPNDYMEVVEERRRNEVLREMEREKEKEERMRRRKEREMDDRDEEDIISPPSSEKNEDFAAKMMAKMGWKGHGLGKQEQGIVAPLQHTKTGRSTGKIEVAKPLSVVSPPSGSSKSVQFNKKPTKVVLLRNMVGPGEVDDMLQQETADECAKYGEVESVLIFEMKGPEVKPWEAVRIFVKFSAVESATKSLMDLNGRFFGGRVVHACFYDEQRYDAVQLAPTEDEEKVPIPFE